MIKTNNRFKMTQTPVETTKATCTSTCMTFILLQFLQEDMNTHAEKTRKREKASQTPYLLACF